MDIIHLEVHNYVVFYTLEDLHDSLKTIISYKDRYRFGVFHENRSKLVQFI
ncbi:hypothetical protein D3C73_1629770 [compost metagenome]